MEIPAIKFKFTYSSPADWVHHLRKKKNVAISPLKQNVCCSEICIYDVGWNFESNKQPNCDYGM